MTGSLRILFVGEDVPGSRTPQRLAALRRLGHEVMFVPTTAPGRTCEDRPSMMRRLRYRLRWPKDESGANRILMAQAGKPWDVLVADNAFQIHPKTLKALQATIPALRLVWYSEDDLMNPRLGSRQLDASIRLYDLWVTTKSFNADPGEMPSRGARRVRFVDNSFDPELHRPVSLDLRDREEWGGAVSFVGTFEAPRAASILALCRAGIGVRVWGNGWNALMNAHPLLKIENRPAYGSDYVRVALASDINLAFLRKSNRDLQTCRTLEIPACGAFMMHERTDEVCRLLAEGHDAVFFGDDEELVRLARHWLADPVARQRVAMAGRERVVRDGHDHDSRWREILSLAVGER